jgi:sulfur-oxidizing protein SoxZ
MSVVARLRVPAEARRGESVEIRALLGHPNESGQRRNDTGGAVPRNVVRRWRVVYGGAVVLEAETGIGIAANPYFAFHLRASETGDVVVEWQDERGETFRASARLKVAG